MKIGLGDLVMAAAWGDEKSAVVAIAILNRYRFGSGELVSITMPMDESNGDSEWPLMDRSRLLEVLSALRDSMTERSDVF